MDCGARWHGASDDQGRLSSNGRLLVREQASIVWRLRRRALESANIGLASVSRNSRFMRRAARRFIPADAGCGHCALALRSLLSGNELRPVSELAGFPATRRLYTHQATDRRRATLFAAARCRRLGATETIISE